MTPIDYRCELVGELFKKELVSSRGRILSIFDQVCNIKINKYKGFSFVDKDVTMGPYHLTFDNNQSYCELSRNLQEGMEVLLAKDMITIPDIKTQINIKKANIWKGDLPQKDIEKESNLYNIVNRLICLIKNRGNNKGFGQLNYYWSSLFDFEEPSDDLDEESLIIKKAYNILKNFIDFSKNNDDLSDLIGLGLGLTPSGDDFLIGLFSVYDYLSREKAFLMNYLSQKDIFNLTTFVSAIALKGVFQGKYSEHIINFYKYIFGQDKKYNKAVNSLMKIGSTSGTDILTGIIFGFLYISYNKT